MSASMRLTKSSRFGSVNWSCAPSTVPPTGEETSVDGFIGGTQLESQATTSGHVCPRNCAIVGQLPDLRRRKVVEYALSHRSRGDYVHLGAQHLWLRRQSRKNGFDL